MDNVVDLMNQDQTHPMKLAGPGENCELVDSWESEEAVSGGVPPGLPPPPLSSLGVLANSPELKSLTRLIGELYIIHRHHYIFIIVSLLLVCILNSEQSIQNT